MQKVYPLLSQMQTLNPQVVTHYTKKSVLNELNRLYEKLCDAYLQATPEERIDIYIAFEGKDNLLTAMVTHFGHTAQQAHKKAVKNKRDEAIKLLQHAAVARLLLGKRVLVDLIITSEKQFKTAAVEADYDLEAFMHRLEVPAVTWVRHAYRVFKQGDRIKAAITLGRALELDPMMDRNDRLGDFAMRLTGEQSPYGACLILEDPYMRRMFVETELGKDKLQTLENKKQRPASTSRVAIVAVGLATLAVSTLGLLSILV